MATPLMFTENRFYFRSDQERDQSREWLRSQRLRGAQGKERAFRTKVGEGDQDEGEKRGAATHAKWESFVKPGIPLLSLPQDGCWLGLPPGSQGIVEE